MTALLSEWRPSKDAKTAESQPQSDEKAIVILLVGLVQTNLNGKLHAKAGFRIQRENNRFRYSATVI